MSKRVGGLLLAFAYLSFTYRQHVDGVSKLLQRLHDCVWVPTQASIKARPHTQLVCMDYGPWWY